MPDVLSDFEVGARKPNGNSESLHVAWNLTGEKAKKMRTLFAKHGIANISDYVRGLVLADLRAREAKSAHTAPAPAPTPTPKKS